MNILIVSTISGLYDPLTGDRNRFFNLALQLSKNNELTILQPLKYKNNNDSSIGKVGYFRTNIKNKNFSIISDFNPFFIIKVLKNIRNTDIIQISHPAGIFACKSISFFCRKRPKIIYDAHNVDSDSVYFTFSTREYKESNKIKKFIKKIYVKLVVILEKIAVKKADFIISVSENDKLRFIEKFNIEPSIIFEIPSGTDINLNRKKRTNGKNLKIIFHGSYYNGPNREAFRLIKDYICPEILKKEKNIDFIVFGTGWPKFKKDNLECLGFVDDLQSVINNSDIAIAPITGGGGTKLKILDYLGSSIPVITTKKGIEGIKAKNNEDVIITEDVNEKFISAILFLIKNPEKRKIIGNNGYTLAKEYYDWKSIGNRLNMLYKKKLEE